MGRKLTYKGLYKKTLDIFSKYIRKKDADWKGQTKCYTCSVIKDWKELQAGHFKHGKLDFDERNIHPQCVACNKYKSGKLDVYATNLVRDYGSKILKQLDIDASKDSIKLYTWEELEKIYNKYKKLFNKL